MSISYIYEILDKNNSPVYIGKADDVKYRINSHITSSRKRKSELEIWISNQPVPLKYRIVAKCASSIVNEVERNYIVQAIENGYKIFNRVKTTVSKCVEVPFETKDHGIIIEIALTPNQVQQLEQISIIPSAVEMLKSESFSDSVFRLAVDLFNKKQRDLK